MEVATMVVVVLVVVVAPAVVGCESNEIIILM